jgi:hypothetical protein
LSQRSKIQNPNPSKKEAAGPTWLSPPPSSPVDAVRVATLELPVWPADHRSRTGRTRAAELAGALPLHTRAQGTTARPLDGGVLTHW